MTGTITFLQKTLKRKPVEPVNLHRGEDALITIYLDESTVRMCLKYKIHPRHFMIQSLLDEIHTKSMINESVCFSQTSA